MPTMMDQQHTLQQKPPVAKMQQPQHQNHLNVTTANKNLTRGNSVVTLNQIYAHQNSIPIRNRILSTAKSLQQQSVDFGDDVDGQQPNDQQQQQQSVHRQPPGTRQSVQCQANGNLFASLITSQHNNMAHPTSLPTAAATTTTSVQYQQRHVSSSQVSPRRQSQDRVSAVLSAPPTRMSHTGATPPVRVINVARRHRRKSRQFDDSDLMAARVFVGADQQQQQVRPGGGVAGDHHHYQRAAGTSANKLSPAAWSSSSDDSSSYCASSPESTGRKQRTSRRTTPVTSTTPIRGTSPRPLSPARAATSAGPQSLPSATISVGAHPPQVATGRPSSGTTVNSSATKSASSSPARRRMLPVSPQQSISNIRQQATSPVNAQPLNRQLSAVTVRANQQYAPQTETTTRKGGHRKLPQIPTQQLIKQNTLGNGPGLAGRESWQQVPQVTSYQAPQMRHNITNVMHSTQQQSQMRVQSFPMPASEPTQAASAASSLPPAPLPLAQRAAWQTRQPSGGSSGANSTDTPSPRSPVLTARTRQQVATSGVQPPAINSKLSASSSSTNTNSSKSPLAGGNQLPVVRQATLVPEVDVSSYFTFEPASGPCATGPSAAAPRSPGAPVVVQSSTTALDGGGGLIANTTPRGRRLSSCGLGLRANFLMNKQHAISEFTPPRSLESSHSRSSTDATWPSSPLGHMNNHQQQQQQPVAVSRQYVPLTGQQHVSPTNRPAPPASRQLGVAADGPQLLNRRPSGHGLPQRAASASESRGGPSAPGGPFAFYGESEMGVSGQLMTIKVNPATRSMLAVQSSGGGGGGSAYMPASQTDAGCYQHQTGSYNTSQAAHQLASSVPTASDPTCSTGWHSHWQQQQPAYQQPPVVSQQQQPQPTSRLVAHTTTPMHNALSIDVYQCNSMDDPPSLSYESGELGPGSSNLLATNTNYLNVNQQPVRLQQQQGQQRCSLTIPEGAGHQRDRQPSNVSTSSMPVGTSFGLQCLANSASNVVSLATGASALFSSGGLTTTTTGAAALAASRSRCASGELSASPLASSRANSATACVGGPNSTSAGNIVGGVAAAAIAGQQNVGGATVRKYGAWAERLARNSSHGQLDRDDDDDDTSCSQRARSAQPLASNHQPRPHHRAGHAHQHQHQPSSRHRLKSKRQRRASIQQRSSSAAATGAGHAVERQMRQMLQLAASQQQQRHRKPRAADDSRSSSCLSSSSFSLASSSANSSSSPGSSTSSNSPTSSRASSRRHSPATTGRGAVAPPDLTATSDKIKLAARSSGASTGSATKRALGRFSIITSGARIKSSKREQEQQRQHGPGGAFLATVEAAIDRRDQLTLNDRLRLAEKSANKLFRKVDLSPQRSRSKLIDAAGLSQCSTTGSNTPPKLATTDNATTTTTTGARRGGGEDDDAGGGDNHKKPAQLLDDPGGDDLSLFLRSVDKQLRRQQQREQQQRSGEISQPRPSHDQGGVARAKSVLAGVSLDRSVATSAATRALKRAMTLRSLVRNFSRRTSSCDNAAAATTAASSKFEATEPAGAKYPNLLSVASGVRQRRSAECLLDRAAVASGQEQREQHQRAISVASRSDPVAATNDDQYRRASSFDQSAGGRQQQRGRQQRTILTAAITNESVKRRAVRLFRRRTRQHQEHEAASNDTNLAAEFRSSSMGGNHHHSEQRKHNSISRGGPTETELGANGNCNRRQLPVAQGRAPATSISLGATGEAHSPPVVGSPIGQLGQSSSPANASDEAVRSRQLARMKSVITAVSRRLEPLRSMRSAGKSTTSSQQ